MKEATWKYPLPCAGSTEIPMPRGAKVLTVQTQNHQPVLWARVDTNEWMFESRVFHIRGTGHPFDGHEGEYVGTFQLEGGRLVFHVFEDARGRAVGFESG